MTIRRNPETPRRPAHGARVEAPGRPLRRRSAVPCLLLSALPWVGGCGSSSALDRSDDYMSEGYVLQAYLELENERLRQMQVYGAADPDLMAAHTDLRYRYLVEKGRQEIYADREAQGIDTLSQALELRPDGKEPAELMVRAHRKLAIRATTRGQDQLAGGEYEKAMISFHEALEHQPDYKPAKDGVAQVHDYVSRLHKEAQEQFIEAIRKLPQFRYSEVDWHAAAALTRDPTRADAEELQRQALHELAMEAWRRAEKNQDERSYGAALMEYRTARDLWPDMTDVGDRIAHMRREVDAMSKAETAALAIQADRLDEARRLLDQAFELSTLERNNIALLRMDVERRKGEIAYGAAHDLELQGLKAEALVAYEALAVDWPDGLKDEQTRIGALKTDIAGAEKAYADGDAAEQAGDLEAALDHFTTARTYYARYRDVEERVERLKKALAERASGG